MPRRLTPPVVMSAAWRLCLALLLALWGPGMGGGLAAAPARAGAAIVNIAQVSYFHTGLGLRETVSSNRVEALVRAVPALELAGGAERVVPRGVSTRLDFVIRNTGNTDLDIWPAVAQAQGKAPLRGMRLYWDRAGNGVVDHDDPLVGAQAIPLDFGGEVRLIQLFEVAAHATLGQSATLRLETRAQARDVAAAGGTAVAMSGRGRGVVTVGETGVELHKSVARQPRPEGEVLIYTLELQNDGQAAVAPLARIDGAEILVDGVARPGVLVRDMVPLNTVFEPGGAAPGALWLYHLTGAPEHSYLSVPPEDAAQVDAVAFLHEGALDAGHSRRMRFQVRVPGHVGQVRITNTATVFVPQAGGARAQRSNEVTVEHAGEGGGLDYVDAGMRPVFRGALGQDLMFDFASGQCNGTRGRDEIEITVASDRTGDVETVTARESGLNSGRFSAPPLPVARMSPPVAGDNVLAATRGDRLVATVLCQSLLYSAEFLVDPGNFVFDSVDNNPVEGARVALLDTAGREIEAVTTDAEGFFSFGARTSGFYRYSVEARGHAYPSARRVFEGFARSLSPDEASWGGAFRHAAGAVMRGDIPVDPDFGIPIAVEKRVDRARVATGGHVVYTLGLSNEMTEALLDARLVDTPPPGARIVPGSVRLDGAPIGDPARRADGARIFEIGRIAAGARLELRYALRFGAAARAGRNTNTARLEGVRAASGLRLVSAAAQAVVRLDDAGGVFAREATVTGSVFLDCDGDGLRGGAQEPGIPGVRIATQAGRFAVTDIDGQYSFRDLPPHLHALSPSRATLPEGARLASRRDSPRMIALRRGTLRSEHFAIAGCSPALRAEIAARHEAFAARAGRATLEVSDLPAASRAGDARAARTEAGRATTSQIYRQPDAVSEPPAPAAARAPLAGAIRDLSPEPGFLDLEDGARLDRRVVSLRVKGPADLDLALEVNGVAVPFGQVGEKSVWAQGNVQAIDYVAVELREGRNEIALIGRDPFGNARARVAIAVHAPGAPAGLRLTAPARAPARAGAAVPVTLELVDRAGHPVMSSAVVGLRATLGEWDVADMQPETPGLQVFVAEGRAELSLRAPQVPGRARLFASADIGEAEAEIRFTPDLAARELVGVIEATAPLGGAWVSPFEHAHEGLSSEVYLRGAVGDTLVTLHYDSRDEGDGLLGGPADNAGFPVFGDSSEQGFDAASSRGFYLRLDRAGSSLVHGDIATAPALDGFRLGGGGRIVTGTKHVTQTERATLTLFAARTGQSERRIEIAGQGITGPYPVDLSGMIAGSDRAWRIVRDRDTGEILSETPLERLTDYVLDYFEDSIIFDTALRQAQDDGDPVSVRLVFETEGMAERHWLYGGDLVWAVNENVEFGARLQHADAPRGTVERARLRAAYLRRSLDAGTTAEAELAQAEDETGRAGLAARLRIARDRGPWQGEAELSHAGRDFAPDGAPLAARTTALSARLERDISPTARLRAEAKLRRNHATNSDMAEVTVAHERDISPRAIRRNEIRATRDTGPNTRERALWLGTGGSWRPVTDRPLSFDLLLEQAVWGNEEGLLRFGAAHELTRRWSVEGTAELGLARDGTVGDLRQLRLATQYDVSDWLRGHSELTRSGGDAVQGRMVQGLQADWTRGPWHLGLGVEHSEPVEGAGDRLTSLSASADWRAADENWIIETGVDRSFGDAATRLSTDVGLAGRIGADWTLLGRSRLARQQRDAGQDTRQHRLRLGAAYRPVLMPRLDMLGWYERRLDHEESYEAAQLWSLAGSWQAGPDLRIDGRYSGQRSVLDLDAGPGGMQADTVLTQLARIGGEIDLLDDRITLGLDAMRLWDDAGAATHALGGELGLAVGEGAMVVIGYNATRRRVARMEGLIEEGAYLRVRMALGDGLLDRLAGFWER